MFNIAEAQIRKGRDGFEWDAEGWYGGDIDRLWIKSEGEGEFGRSIEKAEFQALYSHAVGPYFNVQGGLRYDIKPNPSRVYATIGFEGLARRASSMSKAHCSCRTRASCWRGPRAITTSASPNA